MSQGPGFNVPGWARTSPTGARGSIIGRFRWLVVALVVLIAIWLNYPLIPNPIVLLFKQPSSNVSSISAPGQWPMRGAGPGGANYADSEQLPAGEMAYTVDLGPVTRSSPAVVDGVIYIGGASKIVALEADSGVEVWQTPVSGPVHGTPAVAGDTLYFGLLDKRLHAVRLETGRIIWSYEGDGPFSGSVAVDNGTVYAGSQDGNVYALDAGSGELFP